jgi:indolepyruvate ferredoxin oxidoreductase
MKTIQEVVESSSSISVDPDRVKIVMPEDFVMPPGGLHIRWPDAPLEQEARLMDYKWYAALAYMRANKLNYNVIEGKQDRFGIIASGKAYNDMRQALVDLGLDDDTCRSLGIRVHKVNVVWPLEATITRDFAKGLQEILVIEEKRQVIEYQIKEELYNWRADVRPNVLGKFDECRGRELSAANGPCPTPARTGCCAQGRPDARHHRQGHCQAPEETGRARSTSWQRMDARLAIVEARERALAEPPKPTPATAPHGSAAAARTTPAPACPRARAPWPASAATTWSTGCPTAAPAPSRRWAARA